MGPILVFVETAAGGISDESGELLGRAQVLGEALGRPVVALAFGPQARGALAGEAVAEAVCVQGEGTEAYHPEVWARAAVAVAKERGPSLVLLGNTTAGMDLSTALAPALGMPLVAYCARLEVADGGLVATSRAYGGKLFADVRLPEGGAVVTFLPGGGPAARPAGSPGAVTETAAGPASQVTLARRIEPEAAGDVDITRADILVSVGRGIQDPDNIPLAQELADALGGVVSCSRPVVDAGWLPRSRQVGKSGKTVKPRLYLALGISGAPEHLQGMRDAELIVAINSDPSAPIFEVAHYGATVDALELLPALTERLARGSA
jgi:electron transfer flavoprotein alpha subunit